MLKFECQCCGNEVRQTIDERGLPDRPPPCPWCAEAAEHAAEVLRAKWLLETGGQPAGRTA